jgi:glycogen debranching enzyme
MDVSLWGGGRLGRLRFAGGGTGPFTYGPNGVEAFGSGLFVAQSAPALVLRGATFRSFHPAVRCAGWDRSAPAIAGRSVEGGRRWTTLPWGCVAVEPRGADLVVAAGADRAEAERGLALSVAEVEAEARAHAARCDRLAEADLLLRSLVLFGAHSALASVRADSAGAFAGVAAGPAYSAPARTYYRDAYWTLPLLLQVAPEVVRAQIDLLAQGVRSDGEAPSGVLTGGAEQSRRWAEHRDCAAHQRPAEWWSDHFDSPLFFVLAIADHAAATGDGSAVRDHWPTIAAVFDRYLALAGAGKGLPIKPRHDRDWADNVFRSGAVAYDLGLWVGAADVVARLGRALDPQRAGQAGRASARARSALDRLWTERGWYADYRALDGFAEDHLALDSLTLLRFSAVSDARAEQVLAAVPARLETEGGVRCVAPPYSRRADLRAKSAFPGRYHNGGVWPWLDGLYAGERLRRDLPGWRRPLTGWWRTCLAQGWTSPVEHFAPAYGRGSLLQAWSSLPAATALQHRAAVLTGDPAGA